MLPGNDIDFSVMESAKVWCTPPWEYDQARDDLSIPSDMAVVHVWLDMPLGHHEYAWEMIGTFTRPEATAERYVFGSVELFMSQYNYVWLYVWCRRVYDVHTHDWVEIRWHPTSGLSSVLLYKIQSARSRVEILETLKHLKQGAKLLRRSGFGGAREGKGRFQNAADFREVLVAAIRAGDPQGRDLTQPAMADRIEKLRPSTAPVRSGPYDERQLRRHFAQYIGDREGISLDDFIQNILADTDN